jgi:hypothetical protein
MSAKVVLVNIEMGYPSAEKALRDMINRLSTCKRQGVRAVILVHGYGSSGAGGKIKTAVRSKLKEPSLTGLVRKYCGGEDWIANKKGLLDICSHLKSFEARIAGNPGVTVVLLK